VFAKQVVGSTSNSSSLRAVDAGSESASGAVEELVVESAEVWAVGSIWISPEEVLATPRPSAMSTVA